MTEPHLRAARSTSRTPSGGGLLKFGGDALAALLHGREPCRARVRRGLRHAKARFDELGPLADLGRARDAEDARRHPQRHVRLLPRRRVAPRAAVCRARGHAHGRDGGGRRGRRDPRQRRDRGDAPRPALRRGQGGRPAAEGTARGQRRARAAAAARRPRPRRLRAAADPPRISQDGKRRAGAPPGVGRPSSTSAASTTLLAEHGADERRGRSRRAGRPAPSASRTSTASASSRPTSTRTAASIILVAGAPADRGRGRGTNPARRASDRRPRTALPLRIGVSRGRVFAGEVGAQFRRTYTILGTTAALAARLMGKAEPGPGAHHPRRCSSARAAPSRRRSSSRSRLKGIAEPVKALRRASRSRPATPEARQERLPFVGRERELAILSAALGPVRMGFGNDASS